MSKEKISLTPSSGYNDWAWQYMVNEKIGTLRARLLNLADSIATNDSQRNSIKGLIKDFFNQAYYPLLNQLEDFMKFKGIIDKDSGQPPIPLRNIEEKE